MQLLNVAKMIEHLFMNKRNQNSVYVALHSGDSWFLVEGAFDMASGIGSSRAILKNSDEKLICPEAHSYDGLPVVLFLFLSLM